MNYWRFFFVFVVVYYSPSHTVESPTRWSKQRKNKHPTLKMVTANAEGRQKEGGADVSLIKPRHFILAHH